MLCFVRMLLCVLFEFCSSSRSSSDSKFTYSILSLTDDALCVVRMLLCLYFSIERTILILSLFLGVLVDVLVFRGSSITRIRSMFAL